MQLTEPLVHQHWSLIANVLVGHVPDELRVFARFVPKSHQLAFTLNDAPREPSRRTEVA
jgi:hypothetical protein